MMTILETRKVQKTGGSSYIVSLPIKWIEQHEIKPKDSLGIIPQSDGNLLITPQTNPEKYLREKKVDLDLINDYNFLFRVLIGAYIMGFSVIKLKSSKKIESSIRECITNFTKIAMGPEIIEETNNFILIKDTLDPKEMPYEVTIKRMYILAVSMHEDAINALIKEDKKLAEIVIKRDNDIDRLHWLIGRQSNIFLKDIILCQKMGITLEDANKFQFFSKFLERIGDHAVKIAKNVILLINKKIDNISIDKISKASKISLKLLDNSLDAWLQKDINLANQTIENVEELVSMCELLSHSLNHESVETSIAISYIIESIRRTGEYSADICEIIINNLIKE
jgi:phosphate uptake regulator